MRPFQRILILTAVALLGYLLLPRLTVRWKPSGNAATLRVSYSLPGATPQSIEQRVTAPLEGALALLRDVEEITSVSREGGGSISLSVRKGADGDFVRVNVAGQIRRMYPNLPAEVSYPNIDYSSGEDDRLTELPVMTYTLSGPQDPTELYHYANEIIAPSLSLLAGLNRLEVVGGNVLHWRISLDPEAVTIAGLNKRAIEDRLREYLERRGLGYLSTDQGERLYAYLDADLPISADDWRGIAVPTSAGRQLYLGDLAEVRRVPLPPRSFYRINGENSIRLLAYATQTANRLALATELRTRVSALNENLPTGYELRLADDATRFLREELSKTRRRTALSMGILLLFVLIAYRSFKRLGIVLFGLSVNLGLAFLAYWLLGVELNLYAFAGIAVSFGIMIDNVIIVLDGLGRGRATVKEATARLTPAVIGATLTTLASLSVIYLLSDELKAQLFELARVMVINLSTSLLVALYFVPALLAGEKRVMPLYELPGARKVTLYERLLTLLLKHRKKVVLVTILAFGLPTWWLPKKIDGFNLYNTTIGSDYYQDVLRQPINKYFGGSFRLFNYYVYSNSGYRPSEETRLYVGAALNEGATLAQLNDVVSRVETYLAQYSPQLDRFTTQVYSGQNARMEITFPDGGKSGFPAFLKNRLTSYATNFGGVKWNIYGVGQGFSNDQLGGRANYNITLKGYDQVGLDRYSGRLAELLLQHVRVKEVNTDANLGWWEKDRNEILLHTRRKDLATLGVNVGGLNAGLEWFDRNKRPSFYLRDGEAVSLINAHGEEYDRWRLENWIIPSDASVLYFPAVASLDKQRAAQALHKEDQQYLRLVTFDYLGSHQFGTRHLNACLDTLNAELPLGFTVERTSYSPREQAREITGLVVLAITLIFFICALLFESLRQAFSIVLLVPVTCIGIFLTFYLFDVRLDQGGYISFLLVTGLAVNGLILIVNEFNYLRRRFPDWPEVSIYAEAVRRKLLPIVLTVASTAAGLIPFLWGGRQEVFWHALAAGTIGGLVFSLLVILLVSPVFMARPLVRGKEGRRREV